MIGNYINKIDDKGRLTIPTKFRQELGDFIVVSYAFEKTIEIRSADSFKDWSSSLIKNGNLSKDSRDLNRIILGNSFEITLDKLGRALLPKNLMELIKLEKEVALVGVGNKIEIHSNSQWSELNSDGDLMSKALEQLAEKLNKVE